MNSPTRIALAVLSLSAAGFVGIISQEGYTSTATVPVKGDVPTVGFGTTEGVTMKTTLAPVPAVQRALKDASKFEGAVKQCVHVPLHQYEYDAYVSLAYNVGPGNFCSSTLVRELNQEHYDAACAQILRWDRFHGRPLKGLTVRRQREFHQCKGDA